MDFERNVIPIIRLWRQLLVPLQGDPSDEEVEHLHTAVLEVVEETDPKGLVIDVSGLTILDSHLCAILASLAASVKLMGVKPVLSGLSPEIALALQTMGIGLGDLETTLSLEDALLVLGVRGEQVEEEEPFL